MEAVSIPFCLFVVWPTARPSDLLGEGRRVGVFVVFNGSGAVLTCVEEAGEYRDDLVLALCLDGETVIGLFDDDPAVVETGVKPCVARDFHFKALS